MRWQQMFSMHTCLRWDFASFQLTLRAGVADGCAPGLQTGACGLGLEDGSVSQTCSQHRLCAPGLWLQSCACGTGLADGGVTHALLDVAFSLSHSISISFLLARFLSLTHAPSFSLSFSLSLFLSLSLSLSLSHTHTSMLGAIILIPLMPSDSD